MGLRREHGPEKRSSNPAWGRALFDFGLVTVVALAVATVVRILSGDGPPTFRFVGPCLLFAGTLMLAAYRQGVTPAAYWRNRREVAWPAQTSRRRRAS